MNRTTNDDGKTTTGTVLKGGVIVDGTGALAYLGDVVICGDRIVSAGPAASVRAVNPDFNVIDCTGYIVTPGFVDAHSHSDLQILRNRPEKLLQGVTTEVVGNCGFSPYPLPKHPRLLREFANGILYGDDSWGWSSARDYLASAEQSRTATVASLVGHGSLRIKVVGNTSRELTDREIDRMCALLDDALEEGAAGFSSGLEYAPGSGASPKELTALGRVTAKRDKVCATHMRSYSAGLVRAVNEQISIAEVSGCRLEISHLQAVGEENWPLQQRAIDAIEQAVTRGVDVAFDAYPWLAGSTVLTQLLPQDALEGGVPQLLLRLRDPAQRKTIHARIKPETRWTGIVITAATHNEDALVGRSIQSIADEREKDPASTVIDILLEQEGNGIIVEHCQSMENLHALMTHPLATVITDAVYTSGRSHPRLYATYPMLLGELVRERKWLSLEEAVHKATGKPAAMFHLIDRGRIAQNCIADITVFDPKKIHTDATYETPAVEPVGIKAVFRNGNIVVDAGRVC